MFRFLIKKLMFMAHYRLSAQNDTRSDQGEKQSPRCSKKLSENTEKLKSVLGDSNDVNIHDIQFGSAGENSAVVVFIDGLVNSAAVSESILRPLLLYTPNTDESAPQSADELLDDIWHSVLYMGEIKEVDTISDVCSACLSGNTVLLLNGTSRALSIGTKGWEKRSVSEPQTESVVRGPREGFTENLRTNTALLRRRIKTPQLRMESVIAGERTQTNVCIVYIEGLAQDQLIRTIRDRINNLDVDGIFDSGYIEEYIEDAPFSVFATIGYSEKPDVVAAKLLEGRAAIIVDGSPFVLTAPMLFIESFQSAQDYYFRSLYATFARILRYLAYFITVFAPGIFIAMVTFHQELIPTPLLFTIAAAREGTPFPAFVEVLILVFSFEILREAGLRLPRPIGQAMSIVGALIMGDAAVAAGLVGAPMVIVIAFTAVSGFLVPDQNESSTPLRIIIIILGTVLGGYGIALGFWGILIHLASLKSFGVPYFEGLTVSSDLKDSVVRVPLWMMISRPKDLATKNMKRARFFIPPVRPYADEEEAIEEEPSK